MCPFFPQRQQTLFRLYGMLPVTVDGINWFLFRPARVLSEFVPTGRSPLGTMPIGSVAEIAAGSVFLLVAGRNDIVGGRGGAAGRRGGVVGGQGGVAGGRVGADVRFRFPVHGGIVVGLTGRLTAISRWRASCSSTWLIRSRGLLMSPWRIYCRYSGSKFPYNRCRALSAEKPPCRRSRVCKAMM